MLISYSTFFLVTKLRYIESFVDMQNAANQCKRSRFVSFFMLPVPFPGNSVTFAGG